MPAPTLDALLLLLLDEPELRRWFRRLGLADDLPGATATFTQLCDAAAAVLDRRGRVDADLVADLAARAGARRSLVAAFATSRELPLPPPAAAGPHPTLEPLRQAMREAVDVLPGVFHVAGGPDAISEIAVELVLRPDQERCEQDPLFPGARAEKDRFGRAYADLPGEPFPLQRLLSLPHHRWVILGEPGSGKTTSLRRFVLHVLDETPLVPALLRISEAQDADAALDLLSPGCAADFWAAARRGEVVLLVDGLDEATDPSRARKALTGLSGRLGDQSLMVVTSRSTAYEPLGARHRELMLCPLRRPQQERLLAGWLPEAQHAEIPGILDALGPRMVRLAENPLILTLMARLLREGGALPRRRADLYAEVVRLLLIRGYNPDLAEGERPFEDSAGPATLLGWLALHGHSADSETLTTSAIRARLGAAPESMRRALGGQAVERWLRRVALSGLLEADRAGQRWSFAHRTLREYLAASALADEVERAGGVARCGLQSELDRCLLLAKAKPALWAEVFALLTGLLAGAEAEALVARMVDGGAEYKPLLYRVLADAEGLSEATVWGMLGLASGRSEWQKRSEVLRTLPELVGDLGTAVKLLGRFAGSAEHGADLWWAHHLLGEIAAGRLGEGREEEARTEADRLAARVFADHRPEARREVLAEIAAKGWWKTIPAGRFMMGSTKKTDHDRYDDEGPQHEVEITSGLQMLAVPVTNGLYERFDPGHVAEREDFKRYGEGLAVEGQADVPVYNVSWYEAVSFARWLGCRLPSETEWEYACRGGTTTRFWSGNEDKDLLDVGWVARNSGRHPHPVASPPTPRGGQHPWGLHDLHGNVWEWCADPWEGNYDRWKAGHRHDPAEAPGTGVPAAPRVIRGGCWNVSALSARSAFRFGGYPRSRGGDRGFRLVRLCPE